MELSNTAAVGVAAATADADAVADAGEKCAVADADAKIAFVEQLDADADAKVASVVFDAKSDAENLAIEFKFFESLCRMTAFKLFFRHCFQTLSSSSSSCSSSSSSTTEGQDVAVETDVGATVVKEGEVVDTDVSVAVADDLAEFDNVESSFAVDWVLYKLVEEDCLVFKDSSSLWNLNSLKTAAFFSNLKLCLSLLTTVSIRLHSDVAVGVVAAEDDTDDAGLVGVSPDETVGASAAGEAKYIEKFKRICALSS